MEIYLIRHTNVEAEEGTCYGISDIGLADSYSEELKLVKEKLSIESEELIYYSSPLKRCRILAQALSNSQPVFDERIVEMDFGDWELKKWNEIDIDESKKWTDDFVNNYCPNGGSYIDLSKKCIEFWNELIIKDHNKCAVVTHSGVLHALVAYLLEMPLDRSFSIKFDYGSISKVKVSKKRTSIEYINR